MEYRAKYEDGSTKIVEAEDFYNAYILCNTEDNVNNKSALVELKRIDENLNKR